MGTKTMPVDVEFSASALVGKGEYTPHHSILFSSLYLLADEGAEDSDETAKYVEASASFFILKILIMDGFIAKVLVGQICEDLKEIEERIAKTLELGNPAHSARLELIEQLREIREISGTLF